MYDVAQAATQLSEPVFETILTIVEINGPSSRSRQKKPAGDRTKGDSSSWLIVLVVVAAVGMTAVIVHILWMRGGSRTPPAFEMDEALVSWSQMAGDADAQRVAHVRFVRAHARAHIPTHTLLLQTPSTQTFA